MSETCPYHDPFKNPRQDGGVLPAEFGGEPIPMILRYRDVREAARDTDVFSSDSPFRVPIPSEEDARSVRQLPIETDPPEHTEYRKIVEPFFKRPSRPEYAARISELVAGLVVTALARNSIEIVREFALPLQSRALTHLLNVPEREAEIWIDWGVHVFRDDKPGEKKGAALENYIQSRLDRAIEQPGEDFFSALTRATFQGRALSRDEMAGFANLTFAGGRDTVINTVASIVGYLADHPAALDAMHTNPKMIPLAGEEFVRAISPLTHIGRTCPASTEVIGFNVEAGQRVSLCWASANNDETVFESPEEIRLDRKPNAHVGFGSGPHFCLGAPHARLIIRTLLQELSTRVGSIINLRCELNETSQADYLRQVGYKSLEVKLVAR